MSRFPVFMILIIALAILPTFLSHAQEGVTAPPRMTAVWVEPGVLSPESDLEMRIPLQAEYPANATIPITVEIVSGGFVGNAEVSLHVYDELQKDIIHGTQMMDFISGVNPCNFSVDAASLKPGAYTLVADIQFEARVGETSFSVPFKKVDSDLLVAQLNDFKARLESIQTQERIEAVSEKSSYLRARIMLGMETLGHALTDAQLGRWRELDQKLTYLRYVVNSTYAGIAMGSVLTEQIEVLQAPDLHNLQVSDGGFVSQGRPVYLFGANMPDPTPEKIARISHFGLQFAVLSISPHDTRDFELFRAKFDPIFEAAAQRNVVLAVQLQAANQAVRELGNVPNVDTTGVLQMTDSDSRNIFVEHLRRVLPYLQGKSMLFSVNIADDPRFQFQSDAVREEFIAFIKVRYPDRIDLNGAWRSHLASYDNIQIWGEYPAHSYQNRRAFQFDWQQFHQSLGTRYFDWAFKSVREYAPGLPLMVTLPNRAFTQAESRYGVDREALSSLTDLSGCTVNSSPTDKIYGIAYPNQIAYYTLMRSLQPNKPVVNLNDRIEFVENMDPVWIRSYVQTTLWEGVIAGLSACAFSDASRLFDHPDALDAMATAILDINRLAPIVHAFARSPRDVAILYSKSSKIFDDGDPHLDSARYAYEGSSFAGYNTRFITEDQIANGGLKDVKVLILPETPAMADATFEIVNQYALDEGNMVRVGTPIPYNEHGFSRRENIKHTSHTMLVRGMNLPTEYLHAMDSMIEVGKLPTIPRAVNNFGYPIEGVKSRHVNFEGKNYLYIVNLRKDPVLVDLYGHMHHGRDLLRGRDVEFPRQLRPLEPMLIQLESEQQEVALTATDSEEKK